MANLDPTLSHLLRRAGFGVSKTDASLWGQLSIPAAVGRLVDYESVADDVDQRIGSLGYISTTSRGSFDPDNRIWDARQRWLFRMVHTQRPLQEKMALFWHNHFATGFSKVAGQIGPAAASRAMASKSTNLSAPTGQLERFRGLALGNFRDILLAVSQDPAMVAWLDGNTNVKGKPQENYARELMELFSIGVDAFTESDVREGARVFTGWNLRHRGPDREHRSAVFFYNPRQHDTGSKRFSFPIFPDGTKAIPARGEQSGWQDGIDLLTGLASHPETGPRLATKLYRFFVNEIDTPDPAVIRQLAATYYRTGFDLREVVRQLLLSPTFQDPANRWARYSWPAEFVTRVIKEVGWTGFSTGAALLPLANMGQTLFEPPHVGGWSLGRAWFSTGTMLARMNFAAMLVANQRVALRDDALASAQTPESFLTHFLGRLSVQPLANGVRTTMLDYLRAGNGWTGSTKQVAEKSAGLVHLLTASPEYQFV